MDASSWPAMAYFYGTWGYALSRAREIARERNQRVRLYRGTFDAKGFAPGKPVWIVDWEVQR